MATMENLANITYNYGGITDNAVSNTVSTLLEENYSLSATKTSLNSGWRPGENLTYNIRVENDGVLPLFGVSVQDNLGGNTNRQLTYLSGSARMLRNDTLTSIEPTSSEPLTLEVPGTLEPGEVVIFTYIARVKNDISNTETEITNEATVVGHEVSASGPTVTVTPNPSLTLPRSNYADVRIEKSVDKENVSTGETLTYTFRLENFGNTEATNVVVTDNLPEKFTITSISSVTNGVTTVFDPTDYSIGEGNRLTLPTSVTKTISVPAGTVSSPGVTTITIVGEITA